jgi:hypothetical protein
LFPVAQTAGDLFKEVKILAAVTDCGVSPHPLHRPDLTRAEIVEHTAFPLIRIAVAMTVRAGNQENERLTLWRQDSTLSLHLAITAPHFVKLIAAVDLSLLKHAR